MIDAGFDDKPGSGQSSGQGFDIRMLESLVCPVSHAVLTYDAERGELLSKAAHLAFPVRDGIPVMLISEARQID